MEHHKKRSNVSSGHKKGHKKSRSSSKEKKQNGGTGWFYNIDIKTRDTHSPLPANKKVHRQPGHQNGHVNSTDLVVQEYRPPLPERVNMPLLSKSRHFSDTQRPLGCSGPRDNSVENGNIVARHQSFEHQAIVHKNSRESAEAEKHGHKRNHRHKSGNKNPKPQTHKRPSKERSQSKTDDPRANVTSAQRAAEFRKTSLESSLASEGRSLENKLEQMLTSRNPQHNVTGLESGANVTAEQRAIEFRKANQEKVFLERRRSEPTSSSNTGNETRRPSRESWGEEHRNSDLGRDAYFLEQNGICTNFKTDRNRNEILMEGYPRKNKTSFGNGNRTSFEESDIDNRAKHNSRNFDKKARNDRYSRQTSNGKPFHLSSKESQKQKLTEKFSSCELQRSSRGHRQPKWKHRSRLILVLIAAVCLVLLGLIVALLVLFIQPKGAETEEHKSGYDMIRAGIKLRVVNRQYEVNMESNASTEFLQFSVPFCGEVDEAFLTSDLQTKYYGCNVHTLRSGSIRVDFSSIFMDNPQTRNKTKLKSIMTPQYKTFWNKHGNMRSYLGHYLVDVSSIDITIYPYHVENLPSKPLLGSMTTAPTSARVPKASPVNTATTVTSQKPSTNAITDQQTSTRVVPTTTITPPVEMNNTIQNTTSETPTMSFSVSISATQSVAQPYASTTVPSTGPSRPTITEILTITSSLSTAATPVLSTETARPVVTMTSDEIFRMEQSGYIACEVHHVEVFHYITIDHMDRDEGMTTLIKVTQKMQFNTIKKIGEHLWIHITMNETLIHIGLNFTKAECTDDGKYICVVIGPGIGISTAGYLHVRGLPGKPHLNLPVELIENKEINQPITCTADVGYPPGILQWKIKPRGSPGFVPFQGKILSTSGTCHNYVTSSLFYTPTKEGNGTLLQCAVINNDVPSVQDLTDVAEIKILPANTCAGKAPNTTLRHPFTCTKYIVCKGNDFQVFQCPRELCFDEETQTCGKTGLTMSSVVAYLNEGVTSLKCRLHHLGNWNKLTVWKVDKDNKKHEILKATQRYGVRESESSMKDRIFSDMVTTRYEAEINLWIYILKCEDEGAYICEADVPFNIPDAVGQILLKVKPDAPKISVPNAIVEDVALMRNITCQANVGYPHGSLSLEVRFQNETEFHKVPFPESVVETQLNCSTHIKRTFEFLPKLDYNKMELKCEVDNSDTLPANYKLVAEELIHVIPGNFCTIHVGNKPNVHPYDCRQYIQCTEGYTYIQKCSQGLCFNPLTEQCDIPEPVSNEFDPNHPCKPKRNGVYFPHPFLCNKYIWCVQGKEVIQNCPMGTLYINNGQCTFTPEQSLCYKSDDSGPT